MTAFATHQTLGAIMITPEGGIARQYINKTGAASVKGTCVHMSETDYNSVIKTLQDEPDCIGVIYDDGIADGDYVWVVFTGVADVYFVGNTTTGHLARIFVASDGDDYVTGQAMSEAVPLNPFTDAKHFAEIGHVLESRVGAGLAKVNLHFN